MHPSKTRSQRKKNPNLLTIAHLMTTSISHIGSLSQLNKEGVDPRSASKSINTTWSHPDTLLPCEELVVYRGSHFSMIEDNRHSSSSRVLLHWWVREQEQDQGKSFILAREKSTPKIPSPRGVFKSSCVDRTGLRQRPWPETFSFFVRYSCAVKPLFWVFFRQFWRLFEASYKRVKYFFLIQA